LPRQSKAHEEGVMVQLLLHCQRQGITPHGVLQQHLQSRKEMAKDRVIFCGYMSVSRSPQPSEGRSTACAELTNSARWQLRVRNPGQAAGW
jgi:hypothetical protein